MMMQNPNDPGRRATVFEASLMVLGVAVFVFLCLLLGYSIGGVL